jgi:hypothetical protein
MKFNSSIKDYNLLYESDTFGELRATDSSAYPFIFFPEKNLILSATRGGKVSHIDLFRLSANKNYFYLIKSNQDLNDIKISKEDFRNSIRGRYWKTAIDGSGKIPCGFWVEAPSHQSIIKTLPKNYFNFIFDFLDIDPKQCMFKFTSYYETNQFIILDYQELMDLYL